LISFSATDSSAYLNFDIQVSLILFYLATKFQLLLVGDKLKRYSSFSVVTQEGKYERKQISSPYEKFLCVLLE
jgi:hypothetical protein